MAVTNQILIFFFLFGYFDPYCGSFLNLVQVNHKNNITNIVSTFNCAIAASSKGTVDTFPLLNSCLERLLAIRP